MQVLNAVMPTPAQIQAIAAQAPTGPVVMLNLLKFRDRAAYDEPEPDTNVTGREAYLRYGEEVQKLVVAGGGRVLFTGAASRLVIGEVAQMWDMVALVEYASPAAFVQMAMSPDMARIAHHRKAGLEGQLLILCTPQETP